MQDAGINPPVSPRHASFLLFIVSCLLLTSCTSKRADMPDYKGTDISKVVAVYNNIHGVEATFSVEFEKGDSMMTGDAAIELTDKTLNLRIYSLGFLIAEIKEEGGIIKSNPELNKSKTLILVDGLRNSFFWWKIKDYEVEEQDNIFQLWNSWQSILIDKKTLLPIYQSIELDNNKELRISYEEPANSGGLWYPSKIRVELSRYLVKLRIKSLSFISRPIQGPQQPHL